MLANFYGLIISLVVLATPAFAQVMDYQVLRLVSLKTDCRRDNLTREITDNGGLLFQVRCQNISHFPQGVKIFCPDASDERSCVLLNKGVEFKQLMLLQGGEQ
ncbi:hypothetical protein ACFVYJ_08130 [Pontibacter sp. JAM-7]|uniref:hypothetical protein n=1 Tax=Pontibacter sp. JAM-7 TaxID=3366581 RepID=UPI003AF8F341